jgi:hypothetical protein
MLEFVSEKHPTMIARIMASRLPKAKCLQPWRTIAMVETACSCSEVVVMLLFKIGEVILKLELSLCLPSHFTHVSFYH